MQKLFSIAGGSVDSEQGIISGVSVITGGVEALGHGVYIDATTLEQVKSSADKFSGGVRVKMDHWSGFTEIVGVLKNFRVEIGDKFNCLRADLYLLKKHPAYDQIIEMASSIPESFGLSIAFSGTSEEIDGLSFARCSELYSVDLVDQPAANPNGLFSEVDLKELSDMTIKDFKAKLAELEAGVKSLFSSNSQSPEVAEFKTQFQTLQLSVNDQLSASLVSVQKLSADNAELAASLEAVSASIKANDVILNDVIESLKIDIAPDASYSQKLESIKGKVTAAIANVGLSNATIPTVTGSQSENKKSRKDFSAMSAKDQMAFIKQSGKITE